MSEIKEERVTDLSIIMEMIDSKPYYSVQYRNVGEDGYNIGYSSYNLKTVLEFIGEYFEMEAETKATENRAEIAFIVGGINGMNKVQNTLRKRYNNINHEGKD